MCQETINNYLLIKDPPKTGVLNLNIYTYSEKFKMLFRDK
jgi:hypothetical protein